MSSDFVEDLEVVEWSTILGPCGPGNNSRSEALHVAIWVFRTMGTFSRLAREFEPKPHGVIRSTRKTEDREGCKELPFWALPLNIRKRG